MGSDAIIFDACVASLPPILDVQAAKRNFALGKTTLYHLAAAGEIQSLTIGAPGKRGKRAFVTQSLLDFMNRRATESKTLKCPPQPTPKGPPIVVRNRSNAEGEFTEAHIT